MEDRDHLELLNESLNELDLILAQTNQDQIPRGLIDSFVQCDEHFRGYVQEFYFQHYHDHEVPEDEQVSTVMYELVVDQKMTQDQVADLFDQFMAAALLSTPGWLESQPAANFEETISKIPTFYRAMCFALRIMNRKNQEER